MSSRWIGLVLLWMLAACTSAPLPTATPTPTLVPTFTPYVRPTFPPTFTPAPTQAQTPTVTPVLVEPLTGIAVEPPLDVPLPDGWAFGYDTMLFQEVGDLTYVPIALYKGKVTGGTGTIVLIWNFRSITTGNPLASAYGQPNLWVDGLRLLRALVFDPRCNIGTAAQQNYTVGGLDAVGTQFAAVDCPDAPDTKGWFAGLTVDDVNFVFYVYTDPIDAMDGAAKQELQALLDRVVFRMADFQARGAQ